jgi:hypothetical protein
MDSTIPRNRGGNGSSQSILPRRPPFEDEPSPPLRVKQLDDFGAQAEVSMPVGEDQSKPNNAVSEALGVNLVAAFVLGLGTMWAWTVVQLAVMVSQGEPFLLRNSVDASITWIVKEPRWGSICRGP